MSNIEEVKSPKHYDVFMGIEAKEILKETLNGLGKDMTPYEAYCFGNILKYRLRAGNKDNLKQDIAKANQYKEMGEKDV